MKFPCTKCGARIEATERFFGREVGCPVCGEMIYCPRPEESAGESPRAVAPTVEDAAVEPAVTGLSVIATEPKAEAGRSAASKKSVRSTPLEEATIQPPAPPKAAAGTVPPPEAATRPAPPMARPLTPLAGEPYGQFPVKRGGPGVGTVLLILLGVAAAGYGWARHQGYELRLTVKTPSTRAAENVEPSPEPTLAATPPPVPVLAAETPAMTIAPGVPEVRPEETAPETTVTKPTPSPADQPQPTPALAVQTPPMEAATPAATAEASPTPRKVEAGFFGSREPLVEEDETTPTALPAAPFPTSGTRPAQSFNNPAQTEDVLANRRVTLSGTGTLRLTGAGDPLPGSVVNFLSPDAWLRLDSVPASAALANLLPRLWIKGVPAVAGTNVRVAQYGAGCVVIPEGPDFAAMQVFGGSSLSGASLELRCGVKYNAESLAASKMAIGSFRLKRGYMATIAQEENGTGISRCYVAPERDLEVRELPTEMGGKVQFVRVFPWRWVSKKGVAGDIFQNLKVGWYYDWNISHDSAPDLEYVPIRQNRWWPNLDQDWIARGSTELLGYNEPDHKDQSNMSVDDAIHGWPDLLGTGLRLGSPAVSDGGLGWLYDFMGKADAAHLRVDFVAVHYYRAVGNPNDPRGAATQMYNYLREIHDRTKRPIWVTEWNNGANWTGHRPNYQQEKAAVAAMVEMLDRTPFVERYAIYNWVEDERNVQRKDGTLTPAGEAYRDEVSPLAYSQVGP